MTQEPEILQFGPSHREAGGYEGAYHPCSGVGAYERQHPRAGSCAEADGLREVYSGLQTGEIDGAENNWPSYESTRHYEVARYYTIDEHTRVPELQLAAQSTWDKLPEDYRIIITQCAKESAKV